MLDTSTDQLLDADPPTAALTNRQQATLNKLVAKVSNRPDDEDIWATIAVSNVRVNAKKGAKRYPSTAFLVPKNSGRLFTEPRIVTDVDDLL